MDYCIITDATADLCPEIMEGLPEVAVVPMEITVDETPYTYGPGGNIAIDQFYEKLHHGAFASTSQVNPSTYEAFFTPFLEAGKDILYLCFTSGMSGMYQSACLCMEQLRKQYPERQLFCIDTLCAAIGEGFLVREAARKQMEGFTLEELVHWVTEQQKNVCQWFTVDTFEHLRHGGRISSAAAIVGTALQIKPLLHVSENGQLEVMDKKIRGTKRAISALLQRMKKGWNPEPCRRVIVGHGDCLETAEMLASEIQLQFPTAEIKIAPIGPVIGSHTGPGILAVVFWGTER